MSAAKGPEELLADLGKAALEVEQALEDERIAEVLVRDAHCRVASARAALEGAKNACFVAALRKAKGEQA